VRATGSQRQTAERCLEQFTDEPRFPVVEPDAEVAVSAVFRALEDVLVARLRHAGVASRAEHHRLGRRADFVKVHDPRRGTLLKSHQLEHLQQNEKETNYLIRYRHVYGAASAVTYVHK